MINTNLNAKNYSIQNNEAVSHNTLNETAKISFKGLPPERDCFVKNNENRNDGCPASVDKTRDDTEHIKVRKKMLYACDKEIIKDLSAEEQLKIRDELISQGRYFDPTEVVDIYSKGNLEQSLLSNFRKTNFTLDGVQINSMEGLLQSLKTDNIEKQKEICLLTGKEAKEAGAEVDSYDGYNLYWQGKTFTRNSQEYQDFLKTAYEKRFENDPPFRNAILSTKDKILIHTIGKNNPEETILTTDEFIGILTDLRNKL